MKHGQLRLHRSVLDRKLQLHHQRNGKLQALRPAGVLAVAAAKIGMTVGIHQATPVGVVIVAPVHPAQVTVALLRLHLRPAIN